MFNVEALLSSHTFNLKCQLLLLCLIVVNFCWFVVVDVLPSDQSAVGTRSCVDCPLGTWGDASGFSCVECGLIDCSQCVRVPASYMHATCMLHAISMLHACYIIHLTCCMHATCNRHPTFRLYIIFLSAIKFSVHA